MLSLGRSHKVRFLNNGKKNGVYFDAGIEFVGRICYPIRTPCQRRCPILLPRKYVSFRPYLTPHLYSYRNKCACIRQRGIPGGVHEGFNVDRKVVRSKCPSANARFQHLSHGNVVQHDGECSAGAYIEHDRSGLSKSLL